MEERQLTGRADGYDLSFVDYENEWEREDLQYVLLPLQHKQSSVCIVLTPTHTHTLPVAQAGLAI